MRKKNKYEKSKVICKRFISSKAGNGNPTWSAERERVSKKVKGQRHALLYVE